MLAKLLIPALSMAWFTGARQAPAQENTSSDGPPELVQLRKQHASRALASARTLSDQFTKALASLEKESGAAGEYEQALAAQQRRLELAALYSQMLEDPSLANVIVLKPGEARVNGSVTYDKALNALVGWKTVGSIAIWDVIRLTPGDYDITIRYGVADMGDAPVRYNPYSSHDLVTGGEFEFYEDSNLAGASGNKRIGQVTSTGGWDTEASLRLPPVHLGRTTARFALRITKTRGSGGVMHLKEVRLTPVQTAPKSLAAADSESSAAQEYAALRVAHGQILKDAVMPVLTAFSDRLAALAGQAEAAKETDLSEDLRAEQRRLQRILEHPTSAQIARFIAADKKLLNAGNEEWHGVLYFPHPSNTGDRFMVTYQGEHLPVKLTGVTCPPSSGEPTAQFTPTAKYFGISSSDAVQLGIHARDFTASFLAGKSMRLLSRGVKDADGVIPVTILLDGVGDFAGVLIDNGLAMTNAPKARSKAAKRGEEALLSALSERETAARTRSIPLGGWAMRAEDVATAN